MLKILISPSKAMDYSSIQPVEEPFESISPLTESLRLTLYGMDLESLKALYKASDKVIAEAKEMLSVDKHFKAIELFSGAVFKNLSYMERTPREKTYIDEHLMIFSALYGIVPANAGIRPYRLDLNNSCKPDINDLTRQWKEAVNQYLLDQKTECIVDLASAEYRKLLDSEPYKMVVQVDFKDEKDGTFKTVGTYAKMARGQFIGAMAENQIVHLDAIRKLSVMGYSFNDDLSSANHYIFTR